MAYYNFKAESSSSGKAYYLGEYASGVQIDVAAKYSSYSSLTKDNFVVVPKSNTVTSSKTATQYITMGDWTLYHYDSNTSSYYAPTITYNSSTGKLSFTSRIDVEGEAYNNDDGSNKWALTRPSSARALTAKVYLLPEIEAL